MIWTISDLHLSFAQPKPMDIFGARWKDHPERIAEHWRARIAQDDVVHNAAEISWAMKIDDALVDLRWIDALPGRKILSKGNHDYWWDRAAPIRARMPPSIHLVEADAVDVGQAVVCGTRGWVSPEMPGFAPSTDQRVFVREVGRLERALAAAQKLAASAKPIVVMIHYPPYINGRPTEFATRIAAAGAKACVFGHLHRPEDWGLATQGTLDGVFYQLTSCDYLGFWPVAVRGLSDTATPDADL
jgi:predicted phosphohydrolase